MSLENININIVEQPTKLPIKHTPLEQQFKENHFRHGPLFSNNLRAIICGSSGCGKSTLLFNLLLHKNGLKYMNIYIFCKTVASQEKYINLKKIYALVPEIKFISFSKNEDILTPNECKPNSIVIFDDIPLDKNSRDKIKQFFSFGRHNNLDVFYLIQSYASASKHNLRDNVNLICLFRSDNLNLEHIYKDSCSTDCSFNVFKKICNLSWEKGGKFGFLVIDKERSKADGRFRIGFDKFIKIN